MSKAKLKLTPERFGKLAVAAELSNVTVTKSQKIGTKVIVELDFKDPANLVELGEEMSVVTDAQIKEFAALKEGEKKAEAGKEKVKA
jgi:hypothetical protein